MASRSVEYIFQLIDRFTPNAGKMSDAAKKAEQSIHGMGRAFDAAERSGAKYAIAERRRMEELSRVRNDHINQTERALHRYEQQQARVQRALSTTATAAMTLGVGSSAMRSFDHFIEQASKLQTMKTKMLFAQGGNQAEVDMAYGKVSQLTGRYKNVSREEGMHILMDLAANLPEDMAHIVKDAADPFIRLHSFFKAWNGGAHKDTVHHSLRDIASAIRAGEITGEVTGEMMATMAKQLSIARVVMGDKFQVSAYLQAAQKAATALSVADNTFKYIDFPEFMSEMGGPGAGVAMGVSFQKMVGGIRMTQATLELWRKWGLVDMSKVSLDKNGRIEPRSVVGENWMKYTEAFGRNPTDAMITGILPGMAKTMPWLRDPANALKKAWESNDPHKVENISHIVAAIRKNPQHMLALAQAFSAAGYTTNVSKFLESLVLRAPAIARNRGRFSAVEKMDLERYESYEKSKQKFDAKLKDMIQVLGGPLVEFASRRLEKMAGVMESITNWAEKNPEMAKWATNIAMIGTGAVFAAAGLGAAVLSLKVLGALMGASRLGGLLMRGGILAGGAFGIYSIMKHWDDVKAYISQSDIGASILQSLGSIGGSNVFGAIRDQWDKLCAYMTKNLEESIAKAITGNNLVDGGGGKEDFFVRLAKKMQEQAANSDPNRADNPFEGVTETFKASMALMVNYARDAWRKIKEIFSEPVFMPEWLQEIMMGAKLLKKEHFERFWRKWAETGKPFGGTPEEIRKKEIDDQSHYLYRRSQAMQNGSATAGGGLAHSEAKREISVRTQVGVEGAVNVKVDATGFGQGWANVRGGAQGGSNHPRGESAPVSGGSAP